MVDKKEIGIAHLLIARILVKLGKKSEKISRVLHFKELVTPKEKHSRQAKELTQQDWFLTPNLNKISVSEFALHAAVDLTTVEHSISPVKSANNLRSVRREIILPRNKKKTNAFITVAVDATKMLT